MSTVLVVDDSASMRTLISFTLKEKGYTVVEAADGNQGLNLSLQQRFNCIITDVNMPGLNGIELTKQIRSSNVNKYTPILILTTETSYDFINQGKSAGATGWLTKPFTPNKLITVLRKVI